MEITLIINTHKRAWYVKQISYEEVVYFNDKYDKKAVYTVTYAKGMPLNKEGSLVRGEVVDVQDGMIFNIAITNNA